MELQTLLLQLLIVFDRICIVLAPEHALIRRVKDVPRVLFGWRPDAESESWFGDLLWQDMAPLVGAT
jgi:hypothetical protein